MQAFLDNGSIMPDSGGGVHTFKKITHPVSRGIYPRKRLFRLIDSMRRKPVVWVCGPPGAGKTSLVVSYLADRRLPCLWYQVDEGDRDVASFFYYMGMAVKELSPKGYSPLPVLTSEYLENLSAFTHRYFRSLYQHMKPPFIVVFDNYQEVPVDSSLHSVMRDAMAEVPEGCTVVVISRSKPPPILARLRANGLVGIIDWKDLRLTPMESRSIIRLKGRKGLPRSTVQMLYQKTQGWAAGLVLMLEHSGFEHIEASSVSTSTPESVFEYFGEEIFRKMDHKTQNLLLHTAFLPRVTVKMAERLTGQSHAQSILTDLIRRNYFTIQHAGPTRAYEYHPLFREFLLTRARDVFDSQSLLHIQKTSAQLLTEAGEVDEASTIYRACMDWDSLATLALTHARTLIRHGRYLTLRLWIESLPGEVMERDPWLYYWLGASHKPFDIARSRGCYIRAYEGFKRGDDVAGLFLSWVGIVDTFFYEWGDFHPLDRWIGEMEGLLARHPCFPSPEIEARVVGGVFTALMYRQPHHPELPMWANRLERLLENIPDPLLCMTIGNHLLLYYTWWIGDLAKAGNIFNLLEAQTRSHDMTPLTRIAWYAIQGAYFWMTANNPACLGAVRKGLEIARSTGVHLWDFMLLAQGFWGTVTSGDLQGARRLLKEMSTMVDHRRYLDVSHHRFQAFIEAMHRSDAPRMLEHARIALDYAQKAGVRWVQGIMQSALARACFVTGAHAEAERHFTEAMRVARDCNSKTAKTLALLAKTLNAFDRGAETVGLRALHGFISMVKQYGLINPPWWHPSVMAHLCIKAVENGMEVGYVQTLIKRRGIVPETPPLHLENWPWPLKVYTLGRFELVKEGKPLRFSGRAQQRPLDLLKALIALGGRAIPCDRLADALWPEADGFDAHRAFVTTLKRLRQLVGHKDALQLSGGCLTLNAQLSWVDVWAFERLLGEASATKKEGLNRMWHLTEKVMGLYQGPFLCKDTDQPWAVSLRERTRSKFLRLIRKVGYELCRAKWCEEAVACYQKGIEVDYLAEEFYYGLMRCYRCLGRLPEAMAVYQRCRKVLSESLGTKPSARTESLYRTLKTRHK